MDKQDRLFYQRLKKIQKEHTPEKYERTGTLVEDVVVNQIHLGTHALHQRVAGTILKTG